MPASKKPTLARVAVFAFGILVLSLASPVPRLFFIGACLAILGVLLRVWACGHLRKNKAVIQTGPYAHVKNPLYLGTFLIMMGCVTAATNPDGSSRYLFLAVLPFMLGVFFFYYLPYKFRVEADRMRRRFGEEWDRYDENVPDFIPRLLPFKGGNERWNPRLVVDNSEVSAAVYTILALVFLGIRANFDLPGLAW